MCFLLSATVMLDDKPFHFSIFDTAGKVRTIYTWTFSCYCI